MKRFRPYTPADRAACLAVFDSGVPAFLHADERTDFEAWLDAPEGEYLVLEVDGAVVGCCGTVIGSDARLHLCWGLLAAAHHGHGLGELMLLERLGRGIEAGADRCRLSTSPQVEPFFARVGFRRTDYQADGWGPGMHRVEMALELDATQAAELGRRRRELRVRHDVETASGRSGA